MNGNLLDETCPLILYILSCLTIHHIHIAFFPDDIEIPPYHLVKERASNSQMMPPVPPYLAQSRVHCAIYF